MCDQLLFFCHEAHRVTVARTATRCRRVPRACNGSRQTPAPDLPRQQRFKPVRWHEELLAIPTPSPSHSITRVCPFYSLPKMQLLSRPAPGALVRPARAGRPALVALPTRRVAVRAKSSGVDTEELKAKVTEFGESAVAVTKVRPALGSL